MSSEAIWSGSPLFAYAILSEQLVYQVSEQLWFANSSGSDEAAHLIIMISLLYSSTYFTASNETAEATNEQLTVLADLDSHWIHTQNYFSFWHSIKCAHEMNDFVL